MRTQRIPGRIADRYELERRVRVRPAGEIWMATDLLLVRPVAVEFVDQALADDPTFAERFAADLRRLAALVDPHVVHLLDSGEHDGQPYLVRDWVRGGTLADRLERRGSLPPEEAAAIARQVLTGIAALHTAGLRHLGIVSETVLLTDGRSLLSGCPVPAALFATRPAAEAAELLQLPLELLPPEVLEGAPEERSDVYLAGRLLEAMLGRTDEGALAPEIAMATASEPSERPAAAQLADRLHALASAERAGLDASEAVGSQAPPRSPWGLLRTWLAVPVLVVLLAALATVTGLWFGALELGGPLGVRPNTDRPPPSPSPAPASETLLVSGASIVDPPPGDGVENDGALPNAFDGDRATAWSSSNYFDGVMHKDGVGLLFDLGAERVVTGFRLRTPFPGWTFQITVGDDPSAFVPPSSETFISTAAQRGQIGPARGRYVLLWITSVVPTDNGNRAVVAEFHPIGRA